MKTRAALIGLVTRATRRDDPDSSLDELAGLATAAPSQLQIFQYDAKIPSTTQWNVGVQMQLPGAMAADVSYVGNHGYNILQNLRGTQAVMDLNAVDIGAAYLPQNQDPTLAANSVGNLHRSPTPLTPHTFGGFRHCDESYG